MSDDEMFSILSEQEPDFSAKICEGISLADLDEAAINKMKESYARKQKNQAFLQLPADQVLTDLKLLVMEKNLIMLRCSFLQRRK
ncbi:MAG: hypothetical protein IPJ20_19325 [Flammeovirgaceae bacterium]|nr:hypothetical protein [Flammeovirgaceae bacterium]